MKVEVRTYKQKLPSDWLKHHPTEKWRCDMYSDDGSDHHGVGETEGEAFINAALALKSYRDRLNAMRTALTQAHSGATEGGPVSD